jgi:hypothetical protein
VNTLAISAAGTLVTGFLYLYIGNALRKRAVSGQARLANGMFVLWWQALGWLSLLGAAVTVVYMAGRLEVWVYQSYVLLVLLVLFAALWGLQYYLVFLYTGSRRSFVSLGVFYAVLFTATVGLVERAGAPTGLSDDGWNIQPVPKVVYGPAFNLLFTILIIGPAIVAAVAYLRLYWKTDDRTQRYRIAMVTGSVLVWFGTSLIATGANVSMSVWWQLTSRVISVLAALTILAAYKPPQWVRLRYGVRSIRDEGAA